MSGDWVLIATGRAKKPNQFALARKPVKPPPKSTCPFENLQKSGHGEPLLLLDSAGRETRIERGGKDDWFVQVIPNKFPALGEGDCSLVHLERPFVWMEGAGFHEVVVYRNHSLQPAYFSVEELDVVLKSYQLRYRELMKKDCIEYILIFHNHGREAGASIYHPHSQIIAMPVIPPDVARSIKGSKEFYEQYDRTCPHCATIIGEYRTNMRLVYENDSMVAFAPFASKAAFELRIFPKIHQYAFEAIDDATRRDAADALRTVLLKLAKGLNEPPYNFFIHTAPVRPESFKYYHWHIEVAPKTSIWAGFELGTGVEISSVEPEKAAAYLRKIKVS